MVKFQVLRAIAKHVTPEGTSERKGLERTITKIQYPLTGELGRFIASIFKKEENESILISGFVAACKDIHKKVNESQGKTEFAVINKRAETELKKAQDFFDGLPKDSTKWTESETHGFNRQFNICKIWAGKIEDPSGKIALNLDSNTRKKFLSLHDHIQMTFKPYFDKQRELGQMR